MSKFKPGDIITENSLDSTPFVISSVEDTLYSGRYLYPNKKTGVNRLQFTTFQLVINLTDVLYIKVWPNG